jgi:hypothetical protein
MLIEFQTCLFERQLKGGAVRHGDGRCPIDGLGSEDTGQADAALLASSPCPIRELLDRA